MISKTHSCALSGLDGNIIEIEADLSFGLTGFDIVGLPDAAINESKQRIRTAMNNSGIEFPVKKITVNLAPADLKKEGATYDLAISIALLSANGDFSADATDSYVLIGELALDGRLRGVRGVLPMVITAFNNGFKRVIVPQDNAKEAAIVKGIEVYPASDLASVVRHFTTDDAKDNTSNKLKIFKLSEDDINNVSPNYSVDFSEVKGQWDAKRAIEIAVSGGHNILMIGSPGSGKSMLAKRIPTILPELTFDEALEITKIHSIAGTLKSNMSLFKQRPFRNPHHTISTAGLVGGGTNVRPGELSLAHNGVLFMDELPEFKRETLEVMRQPLEDASVTISRVAGTLTFPCNMLFVASMNPCPCGFYGSHDKICKCTPQAIAKYKGRISGPLLDRIDIHIEVPAIKYDDFEDNAKVETSAEIRARVNAARKKQLDRYKEYGIYSNSQLTPKLLAEFCELDSDCKNIMRMAFSDMNLSARAHDRVLKVARTIADLSESDQIKVEHLAEALQYRNLDKMGM
ncbi:MAG: YifB family Mg chelatase-like AAA ATPase [Clostridiales bacterium]|nr:YifB family Mg chelatase-like AAA ATPase [Clostridiales bacterium]